MLQEPQREESAALVAAVCLISKKCGSISEFFFFTALCVVTVAQFPVKAGLLSPIRSHFFSAWVIELQSCVAASLQERGRVLPSLSPDFGQR